MKYKFSICKIILTVIFIGVFIVACVPVNNNKNNSNNSNQNRGRTESRSTAVTVDNKTVTDVGNRNVSTTNNVHLQSRRDERNQRGSSAKSVNLNTNNQNRNSRSNTNSNPFEKRKNALKNVTDEQDRFLIDTTYYLLTMENGITRTTNNADMTGGFSTNSREYRENLFHSFVETVAEFENSTLFDCNRFRIFINQFSFDDSLRQEAGFYYAECLIGSNNIAEAIAVLDALSNERMDRGVAPKVIVRLGQLYCLVGNTRQADKYFKRLKREFPRSIYNQIADCSRL